MTHATRIAQAVASFAVSYACVRLVLEGIGCLALKALGVPDAEGGGVVIGVIVLGLVCAIAIPPYIAWRVYTR
mgnify:CR=1 FL=1